ncbi:MMPL family transporter [Streptomyces ipomoeae]|uniref:MMPL family transporter n=1 Tax=Streptomyces ipomoeae TaxID=103232 RepID=UPI0011461ADD|nr:hypothetical protein Sipo7851_03635 [Streptomyces ipomoeae]
MGAADHRHGGRCRARARTRGAPRCGEQPPGSGGYQVFLVTRIREAYGHGAEPRQAITTGFQHSAMVITAAAIIMTCVFAGFIGATEAVIKALGFGLSVAVAFDAFIVCMTILPAALALLGDRAWSLPARIDRILPRVDIEGEKLANAPVTVPAPSAPAPDYSTHR